MRVPTIRTPGSQKSPTSKGSSASGTGGSFGTLLKTVTLEDPDPGPAMDTAAPVHSLGALLALQEIGATGSVGEGSGRTRAAIRWGETLLEDLEALQVSLLEGTVPRATLERITRAIRENRENPTEERLARILDEIELRAEVELAKLET